MDVKLLHSAHLARNQMQPLFEAIVTDGRSVKFIQKMTNGDQGKHVFVIDDRETEVTDEQNLLPTGSNMIITLTYYEGASTSRRMMFQGLSVGSNISTSSR